MTRRRYPWVEIAELARSTPGVWRQHRSLVSVNEHLYRHVRRRVPALRPDDGGHFQFRHGHRGIDMLGRDVFDLKIQYRPKENPDGIEGT